jgi:hypothetical protein
MCCAVGAERLSLGAQHPDWMSRVWDICKTDAMQGFQRPAQELSIHLDSFDWDRRAGTQSRMSLARFPIRRHALVTCFARSRRTARWFPSRHLLGSSFLSHAKPVAAGASLSSQEAFPAPPLHDTTARWNRKPHRTTLGTSTAAHSGHPTDLLEARGRQDENSLNMKQNCPPASAWKCRQIYESSNATR